MFTAQKCIRFTAQFNSIGTCREAVHWHASNRVPALCRVQCFQKFKFSVLYILRMQISIVNEKRIVATLNISTFSNVKSYKLRSATDETK